MEKKNLKKALALHLAIQLAFPILGAAQTQGNPAPSPAQTPAAPMQPAAMLTNSLKVVVLEGSGAVNNISTHQGTPPVVEVRDENDRLVEGATVVFRAPPSGPGGVFPGGVFSRAVRTNTQGQAIASGLEPNNVPGLFAIHVTATASNRIGEIDIDQTNSVKTFAAKSEPKRKIPLRWKLVAAGVAAGAVIATVLILTGGSSKSAEATAPVIPTITISPGPVTIGGAH